jgi:hypothetical protein
VSFNAQFPKQDDVIRWSAKTDAAHPGPLSSDREQ